MIRKYITCYKGLRHAGFPGDLYFRYRKIFMFIFNIEPKPKVLQVNAFSHTLSVSLVPMVLPSIEAGYQRGFLSSLAGFRIFF